MIRPRLPFRAFASISISSILASCGPGTAPAPTATETSANSEYKTAGTFTCRSGEPWRAVQISESADVAPGATAQITVHAPPALPDTVTPARIDAYCSVDGRYCRGTSCDSHPPVDFMNEKGPGLTWESVHTEDGTNQISFTATVHNSDKEAHQVRLVIDVPPG